MGAALCNRRMHKRFEVVVFEVVKVVVFEGFAFLVVMQDNYLNGC